LLGKTRYLALKAATYAHVWGGSGGWVGPEISGMFKNHYKDMMRYGGIKKGTN